MVKGLIRLCYQKIVDAQTKGVWEKNIFDATHKEFYMQAQQFDQAGQYLTFQELVKNLGHADQIQYLVSTAVSGYIRQLKNIPDVGNIFNKTCVPFSNYKFEVISSHIQDKMLHKIAIWFYSDPVTWIDTIDQRLLIARGDQRMSLREGKEVETEMVKFIPQLSIHSFQS